MMLEPSRYDKWSGGGGGGSNGGWAPSRDRDRERERERLARAHQMSNAHPPEQDASSLFSAPFRVVGGRDSQQIQTKLGDYQLAKTLLDDPSKSIGICAEPQSPAPCQQSSRRENEFKKPNQTPQNGRIHHRQSVHNKSGEVTGSSATSLHRPPPLRIPNGFQHQNSIDSSQPPIESILKEMKSLPAPLEVIAATPRKELDNKFIFNPYTNKVQENTQVTNNDLKLISTKPGLDNRISNSRSSVSPERVIKEPVLSESDDDAAATTTRLPTIISPIGTGSPSSDSTSPSPSPSPSPSSSSPPSSPERPVPLAPPRLPEVVPSLGWSLSNFINPSAQFARDLDTEDKGQVQHALDHVKEKPSPISELSDTSVSSHSPADRRRTSAKRQSPLSSDDERTTNHNASVSGVHVGSKRGRPPKGTSRGGSSGDTGVTGVTGVTGDTGDTGVKRRRGRPPKSVSQAPLAPQDHMVHTPPQETKLQIFRKLFTVKKGDECGGKGGKGGKGKGGKGKGQVTIIEVNNETPHRVPPIEDVLHPELHTNRSSGERVIERVTDRLPDRLSESSDRLSASSDRLSASSDRLSASSDRLSGCSDRVSPSLDRGEAGTGYVRGEAGTGYVRGEAGTGYVRAEADVGPPSARNTDVGPQRPRGLWVQVPLSRLRAATVRVVSAPGPGPGLGPGLGLGPGPGLGPGTGPGPASLHTPPRGQGTLTTVEDDRTTNHERTPIYFSYFERLPPDALQDEERDHKYYLSEAKRLRTAAEKEQELLQKIMLYLESVLCFVLTGRVLELELETKKAFTIYRETIEYIKSIHSMPQRFRASPHTTFSKLDILSLRVQALLYLRMFKMYNREVKDYYKIVQEYQQKPALAESVSPVSPSPSPATSVTSVCSGTSSGYCSLAHSVPALAHNALLQLTKYYTFLYVAHDLWEQADCLCRLPANQDLFIAVDRKCGPLTLFSTFRHLVQYVRHAISLLKHAPRE